MLILTSRLSYLESNCKCITNKNLSNTMLVEKYFKIVSISSCLCDFSCHLKFAQFVLSKWKIMETNIRHIENSCSLSDNLWYGKFRTS